MNNAESRYYDGISAGEEFPRVSLMNKFKQFLVREERLIVISSPRATGKTSFLQLIRRDKPVDAVYVYVKMIASKDPFQQLKTRTGMEWNEEEEEWVYPNVLKERNVVVIVDDAQEIYQYDKFWATLFNSTRPVSKNFSFVISCTCLQTIGSKTSPVVLKACPNKINVHDFLLSKEESLQLILNDRIGLLGAMKNYSMLHGILERGSHGHIGSLRMSINSLNKTNKISPQESESVAIVSHLCNDVRHTYDSCWYFHFDEGWEDKIEEYMIPILAWEQPRKAVQDDERMMGLVGAGILMFTDEEERSVELISPLAKQYFCQRFYRERLFLKV
jgi:hypothetical protein